MTDVALPGLLLLLTHLGLGTLGFITGMIVARRSLVEHRKAHPMPENGSKSISSGVVLILAFLAVVVGIGIQTYYWQRSEDRDDRCSQKWGQEIVLALAARSEASSAYNEAQRVRSDALDDLLVFAIRHPAPPGGVRNPETQKMLDAAVKEYTRAVKKVRGTARTNEDVRDANPFPALNC